MSDVCAVQCTQRRVAGPYELEITIGLWRGQQGYAIIPGFGRACGEGPGTAGPLLFECSADAMTCWLSRSPLGCDLRGDDFQYDTFV